MAKKVILQINGEKKELQDIEMLSEWSEKFHSAYAQYDINVFDELELVYRGTKETVKNVNSRNPKAPKKANNVPNIVYELIESEVNTTTPDAVVKSKKPGFEDMARMIQEKIMSDFDSFDVETLSDIGERNTYVHGISIALMNWNLKLGHHEFAGDKELIGYHPKQVIPQPNVYDIKKMRYIFFICPTTKDEIYERTGVDVSSESQQYPEANEISGENTNTAISASKRATTSNDTVDEIVCIYLDKDGDVGKFAWVGNTVTENKPKYFYPRVEVCKECGVENPQGEKVCSECGSKKLETKVIMEETIQEEMHLSPIVYPKRVKKVTTRPDGTKYVEETIEQVIKERIVPKGTKVPIPAPKILPVLVRLNIPLNFSFRGRSDVETIRDQQECLKKVWSKIEEKVIYAGSIIKKPKSIRQHPTDDTYQLWEGNPADLNGIGVIDLRVPTQEDLVFATANYERAKSTLGITDSFQGKYDPSAKSGRAKEVQVEQSAGRLQSKIKNKFKFYSDMFYLMFMFDMCFSREPRPYMKKDPNGKEIYEEFNKYELLCKDAEGKWYFNTDFSFKAELGNNLPQDKTFIYEQTILMYQSGALDQKQFWEVLSTLNFPIANRILEQIKMKDEEQGESAKLLEILRNMQPEQAVQFLQLPIEEQLQMLKESEAQ